MKAGSYDDLVAERQSFELGHHMVASEEEEAFVDGVAAYHPCDGTVHIRPCEDNMTVDKVAAYHPFEADVHTHPSEED